MTWSFARNRLTSGPEPEDHEVSCEVIVHPSPLRRGKQEDREFHRRFREQKTVAHQKISNAISKLRALRCDENGKIVDLLISELRMALDEIGVLDHRKPTDAGKIGTLTMRLKHVSAGLEILSGSETIRQLRGAVASAYADTQPTPSS